MARAGVNVQAQLFLIGAGYQRVIHQLPVGKGSDRFGIGCLTFLPSQR
jgi:hypothetical protein